MSTYKTIETKLFRLWLTPFLTVSHLTLSTSFLRSITAIVVCSLILFSFSILMFVKLFVTALVVVGCDILSFQLIIKVAIRIIEAIISMVMAVTTADMIIAMWGLFIELVLNTRNQVFACSLNYSAIDSSTQLINT